MSDPYLFKFSFINYLTIINILVKSCLFFGNFGNFGKLCNFGKNKEISDEVNKKTGCFHKESS